MSYDESPAGGVATVWLPTERSDRGPTQQLFCVSEDGNTGVTSAECESTKGEQLRSAIESCFAMAESIFWSDWEGLCRRIASSRERRNKARKRLAGKAGVWSHRVRQVQWNRGERTCSPRLSEALDELDAFPR